jgi:tyrosine-specific transport protein
MQNKNFFSALAILIGVIIGAGIFGIPYVISKSGILPGIFYFLFLGFVVTLLHLCFGEIVLSTKEKHRLVGFAKKYLGRPGKTLILFSTFFGTTGVLLAYLILGGNFLKIVISPFFETSAFKLSIIFWLVLIYFIFKGIKFIGPAEIFTNSFFLVILLFTFCFLIPKINLENFTLIEPREIILPYGVILFSLMGFVAIPEMADVLKDPKERQKFKKIILAASGLVILIYLLFSLAVVGVSGKNTSQDALSGLVPFLGQRIVFLGALFGLITIADSFLVICLYFKNVLIYDLKLPEFLSFSVASGLPMILFLAGLRNFIGVIGIVGTILGAIEGVIIFLIYTKIKKLKEKEPEYALKIPSFFLYFLMVIFVLGAIFQIGYFLK